MACGLCVNKMADATLSSEDEEIENPFETAVSRGASLVQPEKALISLFVVTSYFQVSRTSMLISKQLLLKSCRHAV